MTKVAYHNIQLAYANSSIQITEKQPVTIFQPAHLFILHRTQTDPLCIKAS